MFQTTNQYIYIYLRKYTRPSKLTKLFEQSPFLVGKSTISTGPCSIAMSQITRGYLQGGAPPSDVNVGV